MLLLDTSGLLAAMDADQRLHRTARQALESASGPLILSPFVLAELDYLLLTRVGREAELALLGEVTEHVPSRTVLGVRCRRGKGGEIEQYAAFGDVRMSAASNVVLARRHDARDILTLDERHFRVLRGPRELPFRVLPADY
jgi:hypothetical protein